MKNPTERSLPDLDEVQRKRAELAAEIERQKRMPELLKQREQDRSNTLPPSDLVDGKRREKIFDEIVSKGEINNKRKALARHAWLTVLLLITMGVLLWWAYRELVRLGLM